MPIISTNNISNVIAGFFFSTGSGVVVGEARNRQRRLLQFFLNEWCPECPHMSEPRLVHAHLVLNITTRSLCRILCHKMRVFVGLAAAMLRSRVRQHNGYGVGFGVTL